MKYVVVEIRPAESEKVVAEFETIEEARKEAARLNACADFSYVAVAKNEHFNAQG